MEILEDEAYDTLSESLHIQVASPIFNAKISTRIKIFTPGLKVSASRDFENQELQLIGK